MNPDNVDHHDTCGAYGLGKTVCVLDKGHAGKHNYQPMIANVVVTPAPVASLASLASIGAALAVPLPERRSSEYKVTSTYSNQQKNKRDQAKKQQRKSRRMNRAR